MAAASTINSNGFGVAAFAGGYMCSEKRVDPRSNVIDLYFPITNLWTHANLSEARSQVAGIGGGKKNILLEEYYFQVLLLFNLLSFLFN